MSTLILSTLNTRITEEYLCNQKENQYFERKGLGEKDIKPSKIADELIGMLNADGGVLVFGVSDKGEIQDLNALGDKLDAYRTLIFDFIHPACNIDLEELYVDSKLVFLFHIELQLERIFQRKDNEQVFLRMLDSNRKLNRDTIKKLEYDKAIRRFEEEPCADFDLKDLDNELLEEYKKRLNYKGELLDLLVKRHLAAKTGEKFLVKNAAVLLFAKDPEKYITTASVRYIRYDGNDTLIGTEHNVIKDERFENNIPNLFEEFQQHLYRSASENGEVRKSNFKS